MNMGIKLCGSNGKTDDIKEEWSRNYCAKTQNNSNNTNNIAQISAVKLSTPPHFACLSSHELHFIYLCMCVFMSAQNFTICCYITC